MFQLQVIVVALPLGVKVHSPSALPTSSPSGPVIGTCTVPETGGWQKWTTVTCPLTSAASGVHNVYLMFIANQNWYGLYSLEWISFQKGTSGEGANPSGVK